MKKEYKELLLQDLSARLPYGVKIQYDNQSCKLVVINDDYTVLLLGEDGHKPNIEDDLFLDIEKAKPYLRSMSSMSEEEKHNYFMTYTSINGVDIPHPYKTQDWLNAHHFDYRGLIEKGLAIAVTEENNPYKK